MKSSLCKHGADNSLDMMPCQIKLKLAVYVGVLFSPDLSFEHTILFYGFVPLYYHVYWSWSLKSHWEECLEGL